jgi:hypothetical protein
LFHTDSSTEKQHFLKIADYSLPLASYIPVLRTSTLVYTLPWDSDVSFGVVFAEDTPKPYLTAFDQLLAELCTFKTRGELDTVLSQRDTTHLHQSNSLLDRSAQHSPPPMPAAAAATTTTTTTTPTTNAPTSGLSYYIYYGSRHLSSGVVTAAHYVSSGIQLSGSYLKSKMAPAATPTNVPTPVNKAIGVANTVTPHAVRGRKSKKRSEKEWKLIQLYLSNNCSFAFHSIWFTRSKSNDRSSYCSSSECQVSRFRISKRPGNDLCRRSSACLV